MNSDVRTFKAPFLKLIHSGGEINDLPSVDVSTFRVSLTSRNRLVEWFTPALSLVNSSAYVVPSYHWPSFGLKKLSGQKSQRKRKRKKKLDKEPKKFWKNRKQSLKQIRKERLRRMRSETIEKL